MSKLENSGRFFILEKNHPTYMHYHLYACEGLLIAGLILKNKDYLKRSAQAVEWTLKHQFENGGIPRRYEPVNGVFKGESSDIIAQTLRLTVILAQLGYLSNIINQRGKIRETAEIIEDLKDRLLSFQVKSKDSRILAEYERLKGGFLYGYDLEGQEINNPNSWCTMFALQALDMYRKWKINQKIDMENFLLI